MDQHLKTLGFTDKEISVYLALLEFGTQPASVIAKKTSLPKTTVLFLFDNLLKKGYLTRSQRGKTQYFTADPQDLQNTIENSLKSQQKALDYLLPVLNEFKNPFTSPPKVTFFEGLEGCRKAYNMLANAKDKQAYEFGSHNDLEIMGEKWMADFISRRTKNKVFLKTICQKNPTHLKYLPLDKKQCRKQSLFDPKYGEIHSSISIWEDNVLILNLYADPFAILIKSPQVAETLKTIHALTWK